MNLNLKNKIFLSHLILIFLLLIGLSYRQYINQLDNYIKYVSSFHKSASYSIVNTFSLSISGNNYANVQLPMFINELQRNSKLLYLKAEGITDESLSLFRVNYDKELKEIWRDIYPENFEKEIDKKIESLSLKLNNSQEDKIKIEFLIKRSQDALDEYKRNILLNTQYSNKYSDYLNHEDTFVDLQKKILVLNLKTDNKNGGNLKMIFDISEVSNIQKNIIYNILIEFVISLVFSIFILNILSNRITNPLNQLSSFISNDLSKLKIDEIPAINRSDEIGVLAKTFSKLLGQINIYVEKLELINKIDPLTGIYNRRAFDELSKETLNINENKFTAILYLDIDNFKKYNDFYGHNMGDITLQKVARTINNTLEKKDDKSFRLGGEEFCVFIIVNNQKEMIQISNKILKNIRKLNIEHIENDNKKIVTISIGAYLNTSNKTITEMLQYADKALYKAKENGRDRLEIFNLENL